MCIYEIHFMCEDPKQQKHFPNYICSNQIIRYVQGSINFPKILQPPPNSTYQTNDMKKVLYWGPTILKWPVNFTVIRGYLAQSMWIDTLLRASEKKKQGWWKYCTSPYNIELSSSPGTQHIVHPWIYIMCIPKMFQLYYFHNQVFSQLMWNIRSIISKLRRTAKGFVWKSFSHHWLWSSWLMNSGLFPLRGEEKRKKN